MEKNVYGEAKEVSEREAHEEDARCDDDEPEDGIDLGSVSEYESDDDDSAYVPGHQVGPAKSRVKSNRKRRQPDVYKDPDHDRIVAKHTKRRQPVSSSTFFTAWSF